MQLAYSIIHIRTNIKLKILNILNSSIKITLILYNFNLIQIQQK